MDLSNEEQVDDMREGSLRQKKNKTKSKKHKRDDVSGEEDTKKRHCNDTDDQTCALLLTNEDSEYKLKPDVLEKWHSKFRVFTSYDDHTLCNKVAASGRLTVDEKQPTKDDIDARFERKSKKLPAPQKVWMAFQSSGLFGNPRFEELVKTMRYHISPTQLDKLDRVYVTVDYPDDTNTKLPNGMRFGHVTYYCIPKE